MRRELLIGEEIAGERLDRALSSGIDSLSRRGAKALIDDGAVFVNGKRTKTASRKVELGDRIVVHVGAPEAPVVEAPLEILFEDESIVVINKSAGVVVNETETSAKLSLVEQLKRRGHDAYVVHRLDRDTTGAIVLAKKADVAKELSQRFADRQVQKHYLAVTVFAPPQGDIEAPIGRDPKGPRTRRVHSGGKPALTHVERVVRLEGRCLCLLRPTTGRTHQIRVHLAHVGAPILGDKAYGGATAIRIEDEVYEVERPLLHAHRLELGASQPPFMAPVPSDFSVIAGTGVALLDGSK